MATVRGGTVRSHVQAFADACSEATGAESFGTYPGHSPSIDRALDIFVPVNSSTLGNAITSYAINNQERYGVRYVIYRQRIWHRLDPFWRPMEDRGDLTQNHYDHVHISFETEADEPEPTPPTPAPEEEPVPCTYNYDGHIWAYGDGKLIRCTHPDQVTAHRDSGAKDLGDRSAAVHELYTAFAGPDNVIVLG